jgi:hypothetical protein
VVNVLAAAITAALVHADAACWRHPWAGRPTLFDHTGRPVDPWRPAYRAVFGDALQVSKELHAAGVDLAAAGAHQTEPDASQAEALAGVTNAVVNKNRRDVLIASTGLVVLPALPGRRGKAEQRMRELLAEVPVPVLVTRPENRFISYEEIAAATRIRWFPLTFEFILHSGRPLRVRYGRKSGNVRSGWYMLGHTVTRMGAPD